MIKNVKYLNFKYFVTQLIICYNEQYHGFYIPIYLNYQELWEM